MKKDFMETLEKKWFKSLIPTEELPVKKFWKPKTESSLKADKKVEDNFITKTFRVSHKHSDQINAIAYRRRKKIQDILHDALENYFATVPEKEFSDAVTAYRGISVMNG